MTMREGTASTQGIPDGNGPPVGIDPRVIKVNAQLLHTAQGPGCKDFVQFQYIHVIQGQSDPGQGFLCFAFLYQALHACQVGKGVHAIAVPIKSPPSGSNIMAINCGAAEFQLRRHIIEDDIGPRLVHIERQIEERTCRP